MIKQVAIDEVIERLSTVTLIDVRTPAEFAQFHITGAINVPLFSNEERAEVGTLYKEQSPQVAIERGLELVSPKLPDLYRQINRLKDRKHDIVIYCWRGGMRSRSLASFMTMMGLTCYQLEGGIRSYRQRITADLGHFAEQNKPFVVLEGLTGTRKTDILLQLQAEGYPVVDLEGLANHRGSIFGSIGKEEKSQKAFEKDLWERLRELGDAAYYLIEGESKRLGRIMIPDFIMAGKEKGARIVTNYPFEKRVEAIFYEYNPTENRPALYQAFQHLKRYLSLETIDVLENAFQQEDDRTVIDVLLNTYYDPKYTHSHETNEGEKQTITFESLDEGLLKVKRHLEHLFLAKGMTPIS
jgi:tRNA 2-selenouridine synthase